MPRFIAIGECMIELSPTAEAGILRQGVAGDTLNTAWYARAALPGEWQTDYLTRLGTDAFSDRIAAFLAENGISTGHIARDRQRGPGLYAISLTEGERSFTYWRSASAARHLADDPGLLTAALQGAALCHLSGITLAILAPPARATLLAALQAARGQGTRIALDPNLRLALWEDAETARDWIHKAAGVSDILLPSLGDENALFGDKDAAAVIRRYGALGAGEIVVKDGGADVWWQDGAAAGVVTGLPQVKPLDTTGAGDSFNGAYLAARLLGQDVPGAIRAGHDCAKAVVQHPGALIPMAQLRG